MPKPIHSMSVEMSVVFIFTGMELDLSRVSFGSSSSCAPILSSIQAELIHVFGASRANAPLKM